MIAVHANSSAIGNLFSKKTFDIIFIDGNHGYDQTIRDIENTLPLVKAGGILCGHDCEGRLTPANRSLIYKKLSVDHCASIFDKFKEMHPGVIAAVDEKIEEPKLFAEKYSDFRDAQGIHRCGYSSIWYADIA